MQTWPLSRWTVGPEDRLMNNAAKEEPAKSQICLFTGSSQKDVLNFNPNDGSDLNP